MLLVAWLACTPEDPQVEAWHGAYELTSATLIEEDCAAAPVEIEPLEPYVFIAVDRGLPDIASVYWCPGPETCTTPFTSVWLRELKVDHLWGDHADGDFAGEDLCLVQWDELTADRDGAAMSLTLRTGVAEVSGLPSAECQDAADQLLGEDCVAVLSLEGTRVE